MPKTKLEKKQYEAYKKQYEADSKDYVDALVNDILIEIDAGCTCHNMHTKHGSVIVRGQLTCPVHDYEDYHDLEETLTIFKGKLTKSERKIFKYMLRSLEVEESIIKALLRGSKTGKRFK